MIKKIALGGLGFALLISPSFVLAQSVDIQSQIASLLAQIKQLQVLIAQLQGQPASAGACVQLTRNLYLDSTDATTDGQVGKLQQFLARDPSIYPEARITGYFGPATERAVQRWQAAHGIVSSGDPDSTGYGYVGPKTRAAMAQGCTNTIPTIQTNTASCGNGNDYYDGGADTDTLTYSGKRSEFFITQNANSSYTFRDTVSCRADTDTVVNMELFQFADGLYTLQTLRPNNIESSVQTGSNSTPSIRVAQILPESVEIQYANLPIGSLVAFIDSAGKRFGAQSSVINTSTYSDSIPIHKDLTPGTYTLRAIDYSTNRTIAETSVFYIAPLSPACSIIASPSVANFNSQVVLIWNSTNAASAVWQLDVSGKDNVAVPAGMPGTSGSAYVKANVIGNPTITLLVLSSNGKTASCTATFNVPDPYPQISGGANAYATIDQNYLVTSSRNPTISGTAANINAVAVQLYDNNNVIVSGNGFVPVINGRWSLTTPQTLLPGLYKIEVQGSFTPIYSMLTVSAY